MKFILSFIATFLGIILLASFLTSYALEKGVINWYHGKLYSYQLEKVNKLEATDILFIGDSSLGNAIDVRICREEYGLSCSSLALTGVFGFAGSYGMLQRALGKIKPKTVVLMQTLGMMKRPVQDKAYGLVTPYRLSLFSLPFEEACAALWNGDFVFQAFQAKFEPAKPSPALVSRDYIPQKKKSLVEMSINTSVWKKVKTNLEKTKYLAKIVSLCREHSIPLLYAHGPLYELQFEASREFRAEVMIILTNNGVTVLPDTPIPIPAHEVGDSTDHVGPKFRPKYTRLYMDMILNQVDLMGDGVDASRN